MSEIDNAADVFQSEIAPGSTRQRDESGRFTPAAERLFEERPVEGDPETGDTRDGGEDARLRQRERDEADGRPRRAQGPPSDDGRPAERFGDKTSEEEEGAEKPEGEEAADEGPKYEVVVDGQTVEVSLPEALKGYVREATFYQRMQKVSEAAQAVQQEAQTTARTRDVYMQRLDLMQRILGSLTPPQPDWNQEFAADPRRAHEALKAHAAIHGQVQWAVAEMQNEQAQRAAEYDRTAAQYADSQFVQFVQEANIQDEKTLQSELAGMRSYAKACGFNEGEIATTYDKRMLRVLRDAAKYYQSTAEQPKPVQAERGRTLAPGASTPRTREVGRRSIDEAMNKLAKTGRLDDAASVFQRILR